MTIEIDGKTMPLEQTSIQFERGEGNSLTVSGSIPLDLETGMNKKVNLSILESSNLISISKNIKVNPLIIKGSITRI